MKALKYAMLLLVAAALACAGFWLFASAGRKACPLQIACLSITNSSTGGQLAVFSVSNSTSREVVYMGQGASQPCYSLTEYIPLNPHTILVTNYNQDRRTNARPAALSGHSSLSFEVYIPSGVTGAVLGVDYEQQRNRLEEKARSVVESYGGRLPSRNLWRTVEMRQTFFEQAHQR
jgi:hypothetical protein